MIGKSDCLFVCHHFKKNVYMNVSLVCRPEYRLFFQRVFTDNRRNLNLLGFLLEREILGYESKLGIRFKVGMKKITDPNNQLIVDEGHIVYCSGVENSEGYLI